jgi:uncharacterized alpha-E superfamily protein
MLSRVADSLYWMSRYLERAEHTARLVDANLILMLDQPAASAGQRWERLLASLGIAPPADGAPGARAITEALTFDRSVSTSIVGALGAARDNARQVREQLSSEMWEHLNRLYLRVNRASIDQIWSAEPHAFFRGVKEGAHLIQGVSDATMNHGEGWHFLQLGRFIERAGATATLIDVHFGAFEGTREELDGVGGYLDWVGFLKSKTAFEAYCQVYTADLRPDCIAEFLLLDPQFPHAVRFAAGRIQAALGEIAHATGARGSGQVERLAGRLRAMLDYAQIDEIMTNGLHVYLAEIGSLCAQIHTAVHRSYFAPPLESVLAS